MRSFTLFFHFSKDYFLFALIISSIGWYPILNNGIAAFQQVIWFKLIFSLVGVRFQVKRKKRELFFYYNMGFAARNLVAFTMVLDMLLFIAGILIILSLAPHG